MLQEQTKINKMGRRSNIAIKTVLVGAIGGQGGNVLVEWLFLAAETDGRRAQALSLPGLSQRGGGTTFYLEIASLAEGATVADPQAELQKTIFGQHPFPGMVDVLIGQELVELGRLLQQGYASHRTTIVASRQRLYTIGEKTPAFDGIFPSEKIIEAAAKLGGTFSIIDTDEVAQQHKLGELAANAILLGALSALPEALPMSPEVYRGAIRQFGLAVEMNLTAFEAGRSYQLAANARPVDALSGNDLPTLPATVPRSAPGAGAADSGTPVKAKRQLTLLPVTKSGKSKPQNRNVPELISRHLEALPEKLRPAFGKLVAEVQGQFSEALHWTLIEAIFQLTDYQDLTYACRYLKQVEKIYQLDGADFKLTETYAKTLAARATYEDAVRVACLKIDGRRFTRIRQDMGVKPGQVLVLTDYLKPDAAEIYGIIPNFLVKPMLFLGKISGIGGWAAKKHFTLQLHPRPNRFSGYLTFAFLSWFKPLRPVSHRAAQEWKLINAYTKEVTHYAKLDYELGLLVAESGKLVKGYGDTRRKTTVASRRFLAKVLPPLANWEGKTHKSYSLTLAVAQRALKLIGHNDAGIEWAEQLAQWALTEAKRGKPISQIITEIEPTARVLTQKT